MSDEIALAIDDEEYLGWSEIKVSRALKEAAATFDIAVSERWAGIVAPPAPWQILPFKQATVTIGGEPVLTGWVESYEPSYGANEHSVRIGGRSKTCDLVDCMPDVGTGEFSGFKLDAIARALCAPCGIGVEVQCDVGDPLPDATLEKTETAFSFLEKLARLRSVMLTDDADGNLVLTQAGKQGSGGALIEGNNILNASAKLTGNERFQQYAVLSQTPLAYDGADSQTQIVGTATDPGCTRGRRYAEMAENPSDQTRATARAKWRALHNFGISTEATITVPGWRQPDPSGAPNGELWNTNLLVPVKCPFLAIQRQLLVSKVEFEFDNSGGRRTTLTLAPQEAFAPEGDSGSSGSSGKSNSIWNQGP
jgi:prophage tail gpP-like protein